MSARSDLPQNRYLARDVLCLERTYGRHYGVESVHWDREGRWLQIDHFALGSAHYRFNLAETYVVIMAPPDYGERAGMGAGLEEFYIHKDLRIRRGNGWEEIPHTYEQIDRRGGAATALRHRYACCHIDWRPRRHTVITSLEVLALFLGDPWAFARAGG